MEFWRSLQPLGTYEVWLVIVWLGTLAVAILPRLLTRAPLSTPLVLLGLGYAAAAMSLGLEPPDLLKQGKLVEHATELGVIIALLEGR